MNSGFDLILKESIPLKKLSSVLADTFRISEHEMYFSENDIATGPISDDIAIYCDVRKTTGDFALCISIWIRQERIVVDNLIAARHICRACSTQCLYPTASVNSKEYVLIDPVTNNESIVYLNDDDDHDDYYIVIDSDWGIAGR